MRIAVLVIIMTAFNDREAGRLNTAKSREKLYNFSPFRPGGFSNRRTSLAAYSHFSRFEVWRRQH
jgi:hypothetical protein